MALTNRTRLQARKVVPRAPPRAYLPATASVAFVVHARPARLYSLSLAQLTTAPARFVISGGFTANSTALGLQRVVKRDRPFALLWWMRLTLRAHTHRVEVRASWEMSRLYLQ